MSPVSSADFLDQLRHSLLLSSIIAEKVKLRRRGKEFTGLCPFHHEKTPSFTVNDEKGFYYCFGCGAKGDLVDFVMQTQGFSFPEALEVLAGRAGLEVPRRHTAEPGANQQKKRLQTLLEKAALWFAEQLMGPSGKSALQYCHTRGLTLATLKHFRLGYAPPSLNGLWQILTGLGYTSQECVSVGLLGEDHDKGRTYDRFRNRLLFPILDRQGEVVGFGGRALGDEQPKYLNSPETLLFHKGTLLFGYSQAQDSARKTKELFIVEGYLDVTALVQAGIPYAVAPLGTGFTAQQLQEAWRLVSVPTICFDGDAAGIRAAERVLGFIFPLLKPGYSVDFVFLPPGEDPDSFIRTQGKEAFTRYAEKKVPLVDFLWNVERGRMTQDTPEQRALFKQRLREHVRQVTDSYIRQDYILEIQTRLKGVTGFAKNGAQSTRFKSPDGAKALLTKPKIKLPRQVGDLKQKILLALALNYPILLDDDLEPFAAVRFTPGPLEDLQKAIINAFVDVGGVDTQVLHTHLMKGGMGELIQKILSESVYLHARFAAPNTPFERVKSGWKELLGQQQRQKSFQDELESAKLELRQEMSVEQWEKLKRLKQGFAEESEEN